MPRAKVQTYILAVTHNYYNSGNSRTLLVPYTGTLHSSIYNPHVLEEKRYHKKDEHCMLGLIRKLLSQHDKFYLYGRPCKCRRAMIGIPGSTSNCRARHHICICSYEDTKEDHTKLDDNCLGHGVTARGIEPPLDTTHMLHDVREKAIIEVVKTFDSKVSESSTRRHINMLVNELSKNKKYGYIFNDVKGDTKNTLKKQNEKQKHCELCNKDVASTNWSKHVKSKKHIAKQINNVSISTNLC